MTIPTRILSFLLALAAFGPTVTETEASDGTIVIDKAQVSLIQNTMIAAPMAGIVHSVQVNEGDTLVAGDLMVQLDAEQVQTELQAAHAAFEAAQMAAENDIDARYARRTLEVRRREFQQSQLANEKFPGAIPQTEIEKLKLVVDQSELAIEQAEHELEVAAAQAREQAASVKIVETRFDKHSITAPKSGMVVELSVEAGEWIEAGKPVARLIGIDPIRVECFVDGNEYGPELVGQTVHFQTAALSDDGETADLRWTGRVSFVSPELHPVTGQSRLWAEIDNPDGTLRAGMRGRLVIEAE